MYVISIINCVYIHIYIISLPTEYIGLYHFISYIRPMGISLPHTFICLYAVGGFKN